MEYKEEDYLMISGLQHFSFCRRQWALIHVENQWVENGRTTEGEIFHRIAHDGQKIEKRGEVLIVRNLRVQSKKMGISGDTDIVEFHICENGIHLNNYDGLWIPYPIEYKKGEPKTDNSDKLQLCAQAMCIEEMLICHISEGSIFYGKTRRRLKVEFTDALRLEVINLLNEMHQLIEKGHTPKGKMRKACQSCSLLNICLPELGSRPHVKDYVNQSINELKDINYRG